jgi:hypothetical protein
MELNLLTFLVRFGVSSYQLIVAFILHLSPLSFSMHDYNLDSVEADRQYNSIRMAK